MSAVTASRPNAVTPTWLPVRAERSSVSETALWATKQLTSVGGGNRVPALLVGEHPANEEGDSCVTVCPLPDLGRAVFGDRGQSGACGRRRASDRPVQRRNRAFPRRPLDRPRPRTANRPARDATQAGLREAGERLPGHQCPRHARRLQPAAAVVDSVHGSHRRLERVELGRLPGPPSRRRRHRCPGCRDQPDRLGSRLKDAPRGIRSVPRPGHDLRARGDQRRPRQLQRADRERPVPQATQLRPDEGPFDQGVSQGVARRSVDRSRRHRHRSVTSCFRKRLHDPVRDCGDGGDPPAARRDNTVPGPIWSWPEWRADGVLVPEHHEHHLQSAAEDDRAAEPDPRTEHRAQSVPRLSRPGRVRFLPVARLRDSLGRDPTGRNRDRRSRRPVREHDLLQPVNPDRNRARRSA